MTRWLRPHELDRAPARPRFDPEVEGVRLGLSRELAREIWARVGTDTDADHERAARFVELAGRIAAGGPAIGKATQVGVAAGVASPGAWRDPLIRRAPGRDTLVAAEARRAAADADAADAAMPGGARTSPQLGGTAPGAATGARRIGSVGEVFDAAAAGAPSALPFRSTLEHLFGRPLGHLRAFTGRPQLDALGVRAATRGQTLAFGPSAPDLALVTHEVTHALQNEAGGGARAVSRPGDDAEHEAEHLADHAARGTFAPGRFAVQARPTAQIQLEWRRHTVPGQWIDDETGHIFDSNTDTYYSEYAVLQLDGGALRDVRQQILRDQMFGGIRGLNHQDAQALLALQGFYSRLELRLLAIDVVYSHIPADRLVTLALAIGHAVEVGLLGLIGSLWAAFPNDGDLAYLGVQAFAQGLPIPRLVAVVTANPTLTAQDAIALNQLPARRGVSELNALAAGVVAGVPCARMVAMALALAPWDGPRVAMLMQLHAMYGNPQLTTLANACDGGLPLHVAVAVATANPGLSVPALCTLLQLHARYNLPELGLVAQAVIAGGDVATAVALALGHALTAADLCTLLPLYPRYTLFELGQLAQEVIAGADVDNVSALGGLAIALTAAEVVELVRLAHDDYGCGELIAMVAAVRAGPFPVADLIWLISRAAGLSIEEAVGLLEVIHAGRDPQVIVTLLANIHASHLVELIALYDGDYAQSEVMLALSNAVTEQLTCTRIVDLKRRAKVAPKPLLELLAIAKLPDLEPGLEDIFAFAAAPVPVPVPCILELCRLDGAMPGPVCDGLSLYKYEACRNELVGLTRRLIDGVPIKLIVELAEAEGGLPIGELVDFLELYGAVEFRVASELVVLMGALVQHKVAAATAIAVRKAKPCTPGELGQVLALAPLRNTYRSTEALAAMVELVHGQFPCGVLVFVVTRCAIAPLDLAKLCGTCAGAYQHQDVLLALCQAVVAGTLNADRLMTLWNALNALAPIDFIALLELCPSYDNQNLLAIGQVLPQAHLLGRSTLDVIKMARAGALAGRAGADIARLMQPAQVGNVHGDVIGALVDGEVALLTAAQAAVITDPQFRRLRPERIPQLAPAAFGALDPDCIAALVQAQARQITGPQVECWTQGQIARLDRARLADVHETALAHLPPDRCADLTADHVDDLTPAQVTALTGAQLARLAAPTFARLDNAQAAALRDHHGAAITGPQLAQLDAGRIPHLAASVFGRLSPDTIAQLTQLQAQQLDAPRTQALSLAAIRRLPNHAIAHLPQAAGRALAPHQLAALTPAQLPSLQGNIGGGLTEAHVVALSADQLRLLDVGIISTLVQVALQGLRADQLLGMTQLQVNALQNAQLTQMRTHQRAVLLPRLQVAQALHIRANIGQTIKPDAITPVALAAMGAGGIGGLTRFQISELTRDHVAGIGAGQIVHFTGRQLAALPIECISALTDLAAGALTALQLPHLTNAQLAAMRHEQVVAIPDLALAALTTAQVQALPPRAVAALDQTRVQALVQAQIVGLSAAQLAALTATQWGWLADARLTELTPAQFAGLAPAALARIPVAKLNHVDATAFAVLPAAAIRALTTTQIAGLTLALGDDQMAALLPIQVAHLDPVRLAAMPVRRLTRLADAAQVQALTAAQLVQLGANVAALTRGQTAALLPAQIAALAPGQIPHLAHLGALGAAQLGALTGPQRQQLTAEQTFDTRAHLVPRPQGALQLAGAQNLAALAADQFHTVPLDELVALPAVDVATLTVAQVRDLTDDQLAALTHLASLQPDRIAAIGPRLGALTPAQLHAIGAPGFARLTVAHLAAIAPPEKIAALSAANLGTLKQAQWAGALQPAHLAALTVEQVAALPTARLTQLGDRIDELTPAQIAAIPPRRIAALDAGQPARWLGPQLAALTAAQCGQLTHGHLDAMPQAQLQMLSAEQLAALLPATVHAITEATVLDLSPAQLAALPPALWLEIGDPILGHLSNALQDALTGSQLAALGTRLRRLPALQRLDEAQLAGLTQAQVDVLVRTRFNTLRRRQIAWLTPRMKVEDVEALPPPNAFHHPRRVPAPDGSTLPEHLAPTTQDALTLAQVPGGAPNDLEEREMLLGVLPTPRTRDRPNPNPFGPAMVPGLRGRNLNLALGNAGQQNAINALLAAAAGAPPTWALDSKNNTPIGNFDDLLALPAIRVASLVANVIQVHGLRSLLPWFDQAPWGNRDGQLGGAVGMYWEQDIYPRLPGVDRGPHRIILDDGQLNVVHYTPDHYFNLMPL